MDGLQRAEEKELGHGGVPPGHSLPAASSRGDAAKATGWPPSERGRASNVKPHQVLVATLLCTRQPQKVAAGDEGKRRRERRRAAEPG